MLDPCIVTLKRKQLPARGVVGGKVGTRGIIPRTCRILGGEIFLVRSALMRDEGSDGVRINAGRNIYAQA